MSKKIADKLGIRFCGIVYSHGNVPYASMYNDDNVSGGSFCILVKHTEDDVKKELTEMRSRFSMYK
jgi:hypothetical protein